MIFGASSLGQWSHNVTQPFRLNNHNVGRGWVTGMGLAENGKEDRGVVTFILCV